MIHKGRSYVTQFMHYVTQRIDSCEHSITRRLLNQLRVYGETYSPRQITMEIGSNKNIWAQNSRHCNGRMTFH